VPSVKQQLWGGAFWSSGYYIDTVGRHGDTVGRHGDTVGRHGDTVGRHGSEDVIRRYVAGQGRQQEYRQLHAQHPEPPEQQLELF